MNAVNLSMMGRLKEMETGRQANRQHGGGRCQQTTRNSQSDDLQGNLQPGR